LQRERRESVPVPTIALVGYTNAGKSTLFNAITDAGVLEFIDGRGLLEIFKDSGKQLQLYCHFVTASYRKFRMQNEVCANVKRRPDW
jgi:GTP-binding protein EngB required for normal cell division